MAEADDAMRERLRVAMESSARGNTYAQWADTILPTVRALIADELRAAAKTVCLTSGIKNHGAAVRDVLARADELDPR